MPNRLRTELGLAEPDELYAALIELHQDLDVAASGLVNAKLILLLANHIGDMEVLREAMALARDTRGSAGPVAGHRGEREAT